MKKKTKKKTTPKVMVITKADMFDMMDEHRKLRKDVRDLKNSIESMVGDLSYEIRSCSGSVGVFKTLLNDFVDKSNSDIKTFGDLMKEFSDHVKKHPSIFK